MGNKGGNSQSDWALGSLRLLWGVGAERDGEYLGNCLLLLVLLFLSKVTEAEDDVGAGIFALLLRTEEEFCGKADTPIPEEDVHISRRRK